MHLMTCPFQDMTNTLGYCLTNSRGGRQGRGYWFLCKAEKTEVHRIQANPTALKEVSGQADLNSGPPHMYHGLFYHEATLRAEQV